MDHRKSKRVPEKHILLLYWLCHSLWLCGSQDYRKSLKAWEIQTILPASWEICMQTKKQELGQRINKRQLKFITVIFFHHPHRILGGPKTDLRIYSWGGTRWWRSMRMWSTFLSMVTWGIYLQTQKCLESTIWEGTGVIDQRKWMNRTMQNSVGLRN